MTFPRTLAARLALVVLLACSGPVVAQSVIDQYPAGPLTQRTTEEIQLVFDRHNARFAAVHRRAAMENPALAAGGNIIIRYTIAPNGRVTECQLVSNAFKDPVFERKILQLVMSMQFGAKDVPPFTVERYALRFHDTAEPQRAVPALPSSPPPTPLPLRTSQDVQQAFRRDWQDIHAIYRQAMQQSVELSKGGEIAVSFIIAADGQLQDARLVSSDFDHPVLESQIVQRVALVRFEAGNFAPLRIARYPIPLSPRDLGPMFLGRTMEEVQIGFDKHKLGFSEVFRDASNRNPLLHKGGKIIVSFTIAPDGRVSQAGLVSSSFQQPEFEAQILGVLLSMRFEPKDIPAYSYPNYPIVLFPSKEPAAP